MTDQKIPDILLIYPTEFPDDLIVKEIETLKADNLNIAISKVENEPFSAFEWIVQTAFVVYLLKPYFNAFLSEAGKDHYQLLKKGLKKIAEKGKQINITLVTATKSTKKLSNTYNQSFVVSLIIQTKNNRNIKLLFDNDLEKEDWDNAIDEILDFVIENYEQYPNDKLSALINNVNDDQRDFIYAKINQESKGVEFFDDRTLLAEFKNKNKS